MGWNFPTWGAVLARGIMDQALRPAQALTSPPPEEGVMIQIWVEEPSTGDDGIKAMEALEPILIEAVPKSCRE